MHKVKNLGRLVILMTIIWCILNESFYPKQLISGIFFSMISVYLLRLLHGSDFSLSTYHIHLGRLFIFFIHLIKTIYLSAFETMLHLIRGEINPQIVATDTSLKSDWLRTIIGNSITLTPGTVTIHMNEGEYTVLWLYPKTIRHKDIKQYIVQDFENILLKEEPHA